MKKSKPVLLLFHRMLEHFLEVKNQPVTKISVRDGEGSGAIDFDANITASRWTNEEKIDKLNYFMIQK